MPPLFICTCTPHFKEDVVTATNPDNPEHTRKLGNRRSAAIVFFVLGLLTALIAFWAWRSNINRPGTEPRATLNTTLYLGWLYSGAYAGEAVAAEEFGPAEGISIRMSPGGPGLDPLRLVRDGNFGVASSDETIRAISLGAPYVIIGALNDESPAAFAALTRSNIDSLSDFVGKRVGVLPFGSTGLIYQSMLARNGIDRSLIREVPISPDLRPFILGRTHDVQPVYAYDETVTLDSLQVPYTLIQPRDYGVAFKGPVYFTTRNTVERDPELVRRFIAATARGWQKTLRAPDSAMVAIARLSPSLNITREREVLRRALPYYGSTERRPLTSEPETWKPMVEDMVRFGMITAPLTPTDFLDLTFVQRFYAESPQ
jgi:NitT/TauT family transport system substrate-binding protein